MHEATAEFVPRLLTDDQKYQLFLSAKIVITGDEKWAYSYDVDTK
jgi:hypothetical protein